MSILVYSDPALELGGGRRKSDAGEAYICYILHMKTTLKLKINMSREYLGLLSKETIRRPPQSRETIPLISWSSFGRFCQKLALFPKVQE
jgi:hypothetical protein